MVTGARTYGTLLPVPSADGTVCCEGGFVVRDEDVFGKFAKFFVVRASGDAS